MNWAEVKELADARLSAILKAEGWVVGTWGRLGTGRDWSIYEKDGNKMRCYVEASRSDSFSRYLTGYWVKAESPVMGGVKRRFKVTVVTDGDKLAVSIDKRKLLAKIADLV